MDKISVSELINQFNVRFPVGASCPVRTINKDGVEFIKRIVTAAAYDMHGQAVAFFEGLSGCHSVESGFVDYSQPTPIERRTAEHAVETGRPILKYLPDSEVYKAELVELQKRLDALDKRKPEITAYYEDRQSTLNRIVELAGVDFYFQTEDGDVYKVIDYPGRYVKSEKHDYVRTKRDSEAKGSLSVKEATAAGFSL